MNIPAMTQMLVSMRAQIDAMLLTLQGEQPAPEDDGKPKCPMCGCEKSFPVKGRPILVCDDCGANWTTGGSYCPPPEQRDGATSRTLGPSDPSAVRDRAVG